MTDNNQIALQLYTVRQYTQQDMLGTLEKLAQIGYRAVELAGYGNSSASEMSGKLKELGMQAVSAHVGVSLFEQNISQVLADMKTLGCSYAVVPSIPTDSRNKEYVQQLTTKLNEWGKQCKAEGIQFCYHNHAFEFEALDDGSTIWETIVNNTDPELVKLELDLYWAAIAGKDPAQLVQSLPNRLPLLHMKDMSEAADKMDVPVGAGVMPWKTIIEACRNSNSQWYIVELDRPQDAIEDVTTAIGNLQKLLSNS